METYLLYLFIMLIIAIIIYGWYLANKDTSGKSELHAKDRRIPADKWRDDDEQLIF